jgi:hypothetical protein
MMNQPLRRVDPLGRSVTRTEALPTASRALLPMTGSTWPIRGGSVRAIVDTVNIVAQPGSTVIINPDSDPPLVRRPKWVKVGLSIVAALAGAWTIAQAIHEAFKK